MRCDIDVRLSRSGISLLFLDTRRSTLRSPVPSATLDHTSPSAEFGADAPLVLRALAATRAAAIAAAQWAGRGDPHRADEAATAAMRRALSTASGRGTIVTGEGAKDDAPMLAHGGQLGAGTGPEFDIAVDPLECTTHPDLEPVVDADPGGISLTGRGAELSLWVSGTIPVDRSAAIQEAVWDRIDFASHLRTERLGEFTIANELHRSEALAITQLLLLYQLVTARAAIAVRAVDARADSATSDASTAVA
jgi:hypothetical protein